MAAKKKIEEIQGKDIYPWGQQMLIYKGKVLKDENTLDENQVTEDEFLVVMLSKVGCLCDLYNRNCVSSVLCFGLF
jgi:UV excision repair protein RAD23